MNEPPNSFNKLVVDWKLGTGVYTLALIFALASLVTNMRAHVKTLALVSRQQPKLS